MSATARRRAEIVACAALALATPSCHERTREVPGPTQTIASALDIETGRIQGTISWNGTPATGLSSFAVRAAGWSAGVGTDGRYVADVLPDSYEINIATRTPCIRSPLATGSATVIAGQTTTLDFDLSDSVGRVVGRITSNGAPLPGVIVMFTAEDTDGGTICPSFASVVGDPSGQFSALLPPGSYRGTSNPTGSQFGPFDFQIVAGDTTDVGAFDVPVTQVGRVEGTILWNGAPATELPSFGATVSSRSWSTAVDVTGHYAAPSALVGTYDVSLGLQASLCSDRSLVTQSATVSPDATTTLDFDVSAALGRVVGRVTANGRPLNASISLSKATPDGGFCSSISLSTNVDGQFSGLVPPGSYVASVYPGGGVLGSFNFEIVAGATSDVGVWDAPSGRIQGTILWNGAPVTSLSPFGASVSSSSWGTAFITGHYVLANVAPGDYEAAFRMRTPCETPALVTRSVSVSPDATTTVDFDISSVVGKVVGRVTTNGAPLAFATIIVVSADASDPTACGGIPVTTDATGTFSALLPPKKYIANVSARNANLGKVSFSILPGATTDIDAAVATPVGSDVAIKLLGGIDSAGGLSMSFSSVTAAGDTTVVQSGIGPPPPPGYEIVGFSGQPHYWEIETSAAYAGPITVCIQYDQAWIQGDESLLQLLHDAGSGFQPVDHMFLDTSQNVVCGQVTSLSPFAIVEPLLAADTTAPVFGVVPDTLVAYATSTQGAPFAYAVPSAVDDVDGPTPVSCTPAPGSQFPVGRSGVTCTTSDTHGNTSSASFSVWVQYQAPADGAFFLKPRADGRSVFRIGRPVPVKFQLAGASKDITDLAAHLIVTKLSGAVQGTVDDDSDEDGDETDFLFKYRPGKKIYVYRWKTCDQTRGTYQLRADLGDGVVHQVNVSLKADVVKR